MTGEVVIGLDVGTTAVKAVAFRLGSDRRHLATRECPPGPTQNLAHVSAAITHVLSECANACTGSRIVAISVGTAMHGLLALDDRKHPLTPLVTWADDRAVDQAWQLHLSGQATELQRVSGTPVHPMTPLAKLLWFRREAPELWSRTRWWAGLKDHVLLQLTGNLVTELSSASGTGMLDMTTRQWNPEALRLTGVRPEQLPRILPTTAVLDLSPAAARATGIPAGTPVVTGAADGPLGNLGTGAMAPGVAGLSLGTSGAVRTVATEPFADPESRLFSYALTDSIWVIGGAVSNGGSVVRWAGDVFASDLEAGPRRDTELLELAAAVPVGSDGLVMLPYLLPERSPLWNPQLRGAYLGLTHHHTRGHFVRAAVEGTALRLAEIVADLDRVHPITSVRITGGTFRSPLWQTVVAAALDRPTVFSSGAEGTALGAAALGLYALRRASRLDTAPALLDSAYAAGEPVSVSAHDAEQYRSMRRREA